MTVCLCALTVEQDLALHATAAARLEHFDSNISTRTFRLEQMGSNIDSNTRVATRWFNTLRNLEE